MKKEMSRAQRRRQAKIRKMLLSLSMVLVLALAAVGGTIAWLTDKTAAITNTFTVGNIDIELTETKDDFKMIPGNTIDKDPKVTVKKGSEASWVFVKIEESANLDTYITYTVDSAWKMLEEGVYYIDQASLLDENAVDAVYSVITGDKVTVNSNISKDQMDAFTATPSPEPLPTLTFTAYAIQKANFATPAAAWAELNASAGN